jgi:hypothetical protein
VTGDPRIRPELRLYLEQLVKLLRATVELEAAYLIGSAAMGSYEHGKSDRKGPPGRSSVLNACRPWRWLRTGEWVSKPAAADWLRHAVRCQVEAVE